ncbi:uncharacterized protein si:dkey-261l7.2 [Esox lucius]|uniref:uncharacterized protein si:dkey-261l7.2 n=1 Tax=Esox lucius TaxID=8010 RepID=UPI0005771519|nr:uncharacterized protein si:dkey-261l7.2 [Esox lucius]XP_012993996.2 uncharacterized protein si:dkey-261l7.2 [Esox lucius]XP_028970213.1 uncharacterized protein si:dkey-261l7.2 [Esox lucius]XP_028970214.1 uncharacterized protein si:dkey-261l7.2 [Esox lucius]
MPQLTATTILQLTLLLSALPVQYLISQWTGASVAQRYHATKRLLGLWAEWRKNYLNTTVWTDWLSQLMEDFTVLVSGGETEVIPAQTLDLEAMLQDNDLGFFGASRSARRPRPPFVFLRVGDVVMETSGHMVGVIVSWDPEPRAPPEWIHRLNPVTEGRKWEHTPHYKVLFSGPVPSSLLVGYLPQTRLERLPGTRPEIPTLEKYFTHFDGERFVMQPWLQEIFPED